MQQKNYEIYDLFSATPPPQQAQRRRNKTEKSKTYKEVGHCVKINYFYNKKSLATKL